MDPCAEHLQMLYTGWRPSAKVSRTQQENSQPPSQRAFLKAHLGQTFKEKPVSSLRRPPTSTAVAGLQLLQINGSQCSKTTASPPSPQFLGSSEAVPTALPLVGPLAACQQLPGSGRASDFGRTWSFDLSVSPKYLPLGCLYSTGPNP